MQHFSLRSSPARGAFSQRITHSYPIIVSLRVAHFQPSSYRVIARNLTTLSNCTKFLLPGSFLPRQNYRIPSSSNSRLVLFHFYAEKRNIYCVYSLIKQLSSPLITGIVERKRRHLVPLHYYLTHVPHQRSLRSVIMDPCKLFRVCTRRRMSFDLWILMRDVPPAWAILLTFDACRLHKMAGLNVIRAMQAPVKL